MTLKRTLIFFCLSCSLFTAIAQTSPAGYAARWKVVDSLIEKRGLTASALTEVKKIYSLATTEHNEAQQIRVLIYRIGLEEEKNDDAVPPAISELEGALEAAVKEAQQPNRAILQSLLASAYWNYFAENRWKFYNRTNTVNFVKEDISTWSPDDLKEKVSALYLASLKDEKLLQQTKLDGFAPIIIKGNVPLLRPTLFDLLGHRALDYFKSSENDISQPAALFLLEDPAAFSDAASFVNHSFAPSNTASIHYKALLLFQRLIGFHLRDARPDALIDVDIERIQFCYNNSVPDNQQGLYIRALQQITGRYQDLPAAAQAWYLQAKLYSTLADGSQSPADSMWNGKIKAKAICERVLAQKDSSEGRFNCQQLLNELQAKTLTIHTEKVNLPNRPFRSLVTWRNFNQLYLRLIRMDSKETPMLRSDVAVWDDKYWDKLLRMPIYRDLSLALPPTTDLRVHNTEIAIGSLPPGAYALIGSDNSSWTKGSMMSVEYIYVSSIAYINHGNDYFVVNRESGQPMAGAVIQTWKDVYKNPGGRSLVKRESYVTDGNGHCLLKNKNVNNEYGQVYLEVTVPGDHLFMTDAVIPFSYASSESVPKEQDAAGFEKEHARAFLFLDRSIYRPGQTVYFKGILVTQDQATQKAKVMAARQTKIRLFNANNEMVDSLNLTTDEYGSYHGTFRLPENQLNGTFRINDEFANSYQGFSVEEYKRALFYAEYEKQKGSYRVGDSIRVTGNAKAYAGNSIEGATVRYRVVRQIRYPHPWLLRREGGWTSSGEQEITQGETRTDAKGSFHLVFNAKADRAIPPSTDPQFVYEVTADITDINGETRTATTRIVAAYKALNLSLSIPNGDHLPADSCRTLSVSTTNLSGEPQSCRVHVVIYPLQFPHRLIRERLWDKPDLFLLGEKEFLDSFPHDEYREETKKEDWARGEKAWEATDSTRSGENGSVLLPIPEGRLQPGWYVIETTTTDQYGQEVKDLHYAELYDGKTGRPANPQYKWSFNQQETAAPGEKARINTGSSAENVFVIRDLIHAGQDNASGVFSYLSLNNGKKTTEWEVTEAERGGLGISEAFVKDNRLYASESIVKVPWTNKQLQIHYTTYRDKMQPGSGEKWEVKISGDKGEQASAEMLTSMYDASLDQFTPQSWAVPALYPELYLGSGWTGSSNFESTYTQTKELTVASEYEKQYDQLLFYDRSQNARYRAYGITSLLKGRVNGISVEKKSRMSAAAPMSKFVEQDMAVQPAEALPREDSTAIAIDMAKPAIGEQAPVQLRRDFNETAFFFPDLRTDDSGNVSFSFTMPEALTRWKWMTLAHTKDLSFGYSEKEVVTQKELMVQANVPRFLREGDRLELPFKIVNMTDSEMTGQVALQLTDPTTGQTADGWFTNLQANQYFTVGARQSVVVSFPIDVPFQYSRPLTYRVMATAGNFSDGEEAILPVVSNRMLVTESLPLNMPGNGTRSFRFDKLLQSGGSETLNHYALTVEFTSNPTWYAVQALPYLMEYPYECAEQTFNRFYANALAMKIVNGSPRIQQVFADWRTADTAALLSNLEKNPELKSILLQETPWVLEGKSEDQQKKNIALLFDMVRMSRELDASLNKLKNMQSASGGFVWFKGGGDDRCITQYILTGIAHLQRLQAIPTDLAGKIKDIVTAALPYVDGQLKKDYEASKKTPGIGALQAQYLYMRSMFNDYGIPGSIFPAVNYFRKQAQHSWLQSGRFMQGMIALALFRTGDVQTARNIMASLRENAISSEELGMYWKGMEGGYYWYQAPIEMQSLLIEAFHEIAPDKGIDRDLKTWLLKQKQTHNWPTTKATADACYALLMGADDVLGATGKLTIQLGDKTISSGDGGNAGSEAGTGYFKKVFDGPFVNPSMGNITVSMQPAGKATGATPAWGAVYWQYFEMLDKITPAGGAKAPLKLVKKLFIEKNTDRGPVLEPLGDNGVLRPGDKVKVRIELRSDRDLEYVHMKDMRAACMEPVNVLSGYQWQGGLGYYESTRDASTDFFFSWLPKGTYVFEYPLFVGQAGNFSNGVTSIECMYAPEFSYHSEGIRVNVEQPAP